VPVDSPPDLYGLPLSHFIPERQALVKELRSQKRRDEATEVAGMRKPSVAAWAVNQLVRTQDKAIRVLFQAGDDLARAQAEAASGQRTADALRSANRRQRDALDDLLSAAQGLLSPEGHPLTVATLERVTDTLRAASIDGASREQVIDGCLSQELQFAGLGIGDLAALTLEDRPAQGTRPKPKQTTKRAARQAEAPGAAKPGAAPGARTAKVERTRKAQQKDEAAREAAAARVRKAALTAARQTEVKARRAAARAEKELMVAQARREDAAASLTRAQELLTAAAKRAEETSAELKHARRSLGDLDAAP
jgi:hypothetical protein